MESVVAHDPESLTAFRRAGPPETIRCPFGMNPATRVGAPPGKFRNGRAAGKAGRDGPDGRGRQRRRVTAGGGGARAAWPPDGTLDPASGNPPQRG